MPRTVERASIEPTPICNTQIYTAKCKFMCINTSTGYLLLACVHDCSDSLQDFRLSRTKRQSKRLLVCRGSHGVAACPDVAALRRTLKVGSKDRTKNPNRQAIRRKSDKKVIY